MFNCVICIQLFLLLSLNEETMSSIDESSRTIHILDGTFIAWNHLPTGKRKMNKCMVDQEWTIFRPSGAVHTTKNSLIWTVDGDGCSCSSIKSFTEINRCNQYLEYNLSKIHCFMMNIFIIDHFKYQNRWEWFPSNKWEWYSKCRRDVSSWIEHCSSVFVCALLNISFYLFLFSNWAVWYQWYYQWIFVCDRWSKEKQQIPWLSFLRNLFECTEEILVAMNTKIDNLSKKIFNHE